MAYAPGIRIPYFSSPGVRYRNRPTGSSTANNVLTINATASTTAAFRGSNQAPRITLSIPGGRETFGGPTNLILSASIDDDEGVDSVIFFTRSTRLGISRVFPFRLPWVGASGGNQTLTARVYDKGGLSTLSDGVEVTLNTSGLALPWNDAFLGLKGETGGATISDGVYTLQSAGSDFATPSDGGHFAYQPVNGNATFIARIVSVENTAATAKAGIMFRDTISTGGKNTFAALLPNGDVKIQVRSARNGTTTAL